MPTTVTSKGQVTIPKRIRDHLGIAEARLATDVFPNTAGVHPLGALVRSA